MPRVKPILLLPVLLIGMQFLSARSLPGVYVGNFGLPGSSVESIESFSPGLHLNIPCRSSLQKSKFLPFQFRSNERPKFTGRDIGRQVGGAFGGMLVGALIGTVVGGVVGGIAAGPTHPDLRWWGTPSENQAMGYGALAGSYVGIALGIWMVGNDDYSSGSLPATLSGTLLGGGIGFALAYVSYGVLSPLALILPYAGGLLAYNMSRKINETAEPFSQPGADEAIQPPKMHREFSTQDSAPVTPMSIPGSWTVPILNLRF